MLKVLIAALIMSLIAGTIAIFGINRAFVLGSTLDNLMSLIAIVLGFWGLVLGAGITLGQIFGELI